MHRKRLDIKILLIGPLPKPIHGMSLCNSICLKIFKERLSKAYSINTAHKKFNENLGKFNFKLALNFAGYYFQSYKIFKADKVYITIGQTFLGVLKYSPFILLSKLLKKELIVHIHGNYLHLRYKDLKGLKKLCIRFLMKHFDKGIVLSEKFKINLKPFLKKEKIFVAVNFFEEKFLSNAKEKNFESLKICYLSNLMKEKGIFDLINALIIFNKKNKNFKAKIAGQIDMKARQFFFNKIKTLKNIEYLGVVEGAVKRNLLRDSNVFILPTYYKMEGQPISIIEAMASGNLIISTAHAGIPELVEDEVNGFLVNKKSPEEISDKLFFLANNLCVLKDFSLRNINKANLKFSLKNFEKTMINIISK